MDDKLTQQSWTITGTKANEITSINLDVLCPYCSSQYVNAEVNFYNIRNAICKRCGRTFYLFITILTDMQMTDIDLIGDK